MTTPPNARLNWAQIDGSAGEPSGGIVTSIALARRPNSTTLGVRMHCLYPLTRSGRVWARYKPSASRTKGMFCARASVMTRAQVSCMRGSRPRPGPMTMTWRRGSMAMTEEAMESGVSVEVEEERRGIEARGEILWDCRIRGWTIRLGE